jgi:AcrR family transcriptional regulator
VSGKAELRRRGTGRPPAGTASARDALLRAAATHFSRYGYAGASTRSIVADAGTTAPVLYHHFGNKTGLYIAAAAAALEHVLGAFIAAVANRNSLADRVSALLAAVVALRREHPNVAKYLGVIQQDIGRHSELRDLSSYEPKFEQFWQSVTGDAPSAPRLAVALRAVVEGLLAVGGTDAQADDVAAAAQVLERITRGGLHG